MKNVTLWSFITIVPLLVLCGLGLAAAERQPDYWPTNAWKTASPESQGMDSRVLATMLDTIGEDGLDIHSILIIRNGYMVLDAYAYPFDAGIAHHIDACTQSITSALVGIAMDKGYLKDVSQPVLSFFPERAPKNLDAAKKAMTVENLLTMTTGLECSDPFLYLQSGMMDMIIPAAWRMSTDWVQYILDLPMAEAPGRRYQYCNGAPFLLAAILQQQTGMNALEFARNTLFAPLGISEVGWPSNPQGITLGYGQLFMRPQDMAKIGYLYLNHGVWDDRQIISSQWIKASTRMHVSAAPLTAYGYNWWIVRPGIYTAAGNKGQYIMVVPEKNLVAVFTGRLSPKAFFIPLDLLDAYIIPAIKSDSPLPANTTAENALKSGSALWQNTAPSDREKMAPKAKSNDP